MRSILGLASLAMALVVGLPADAADVNVYSARKDALITPLLDQFSKETGIKVNLITGKADALLSRIAAEGAATPADVFITVDAGRLHRARIAGVLDPIKSDIINKRVPANLRDPEGFWIGLTLRARPIFYAKDRVNPSTLTTYEALTDAQWHGKICIRSSGNIYNQSLVASMIATTGIEATENWARGMVNNFARKPTGGDTDQIYAVAAGQCDLAIANTYYYGRLLDSEKKSDRETAEKVGVFWPNQSDRGTHVNVSGAAITKYSKNRDEAIQLLEFMVSDAAQTYYAEINHEYPVVPSASVSTSIKTLGEFTSDTVNLSMLGVYNTDAVKLMDRVGWQ